YLSEYYAGLSQPDYGPLFTHALAMGHALLLLDGLDEVREDRPGIIRCLEAFVHEWDAQGNRFIATSRSVGYDDAPLDTRLFTSVVIQPLSDQQIQTFIDRWSHAYESLAEPVWPESGDLYHDLVRDASATELAIRVAQHARSLAAAVFADANVAALARNPLLLTILALIHNQGACLPDRRVDLYRLCVEALAETWNRARSLSGRPVDLYLGNERLDERFVVNLLGPVALWIHGDQPGGLVDQDDLESRIAATLAQTDGLPRGRARRLAQDFIELMRRDTGLLQERGYRRFGFLHLTFEEYLAARGLIESVTVDDPDNLFHRYSGSARWREVLRLAIAAAPQREAQRLLLHLLAAPAPRDRAVVLAGECLLDIGRNGATQRAWGAVVEALLALIANSAASLDSRIATGTILGRLGDPRRLDMSSGEASGADQSASAYWCPITPGPFWCGDEGPARRARAGSLRHVELGHSLKIARFPVTNAEFRDFIAAGGYTEHRWWSEAGWLAPPPAHQPAYWEATEYRAPAQPVVGVSWYEASAYCVWLSAVGHQAGWLSADEWLRLPTAIEWERAARHTDRRRYPWGDQPPTDARAAFAALGMAAPAPVGAFPGGTAVCGAQDLSGNVWEWTASLAESSESAEPCEDVNPGETPVIKGGAFDSKAEELRCGASSWLRPGQRVAHLGFRIVRTLGRSRGESPPLKGRASSRV
ncbi:MAG: SUMF1/EgtB/PvdO family nonheme iron enzyme, partial [Chloroflexales bacterium]